MDDVKRPGKSSPTNVEVKMSPEPTVIVPDQPADESPAESQPTVITPSTDEPVTTTPEPSEKPVDIPLPARKRTPVAAIFVAVIVCLVLIGLTVFAYFKTQEKDEANNTNSTQTETEMAAPEDIDASTEAIDQQMNSVNDDQDYSDSELTDQTLGL